MNPEKLARVTIEDAQQALERRHSLEASGRDPGPDAILVVGALLDRLLVMGEQHAVIATDDDGYIVEGALQNGFDMIDNDGALLVVHQNDLIAWVKMMHKHTAEANDLAVRRYNLVRKHARGTFVGMENNTPEQFDEMVDSLDTVELPPIAPAPIEPPDETLESRIARAVVHLRAAQERNDAQQKLTVAGSPEWHGHETVDDRLHDALGALGE